MFPDRGGWRVQWQTKGQRRSKKFPDKASARKFELELELGIADTGRAERYVPTFEAFARRWLDEYSRVEKRATSHGEDRRVIERHLIPALGPKRVSYLRKADLVELRSKLLSTTAKGKETTLHPKTVNNVLLVAKRVMSYAVELDVLAENPWKLVKLCKVTERDFDFWQPEERDAFYRAALLDGPDLAQLAYLACHTGLRKGELAALTWNAVDFERRKLKVAASYNVLLAKVTSTKGGEVAEVPLNDAAIGVLRARAAAKVGTGVFPVELFQNLRRDFSSLCRRVGARPIRFHDTRHTFASTLAMAGVDLLVIQQLMRHKSYQMTLRYAHLHPSHLAGATDILCTQDARRAERETVSKRKPLKRWRTLSDSNARPSGSKEVKAS